MHGMLQRRRLSKGRFRQEATRSCDVHPSRMLATSPPSSGGRREPMQSRIPLLGQQERVSCYR